MLRGTSSEILHTWSSTVSPLGRLKPRLHAKYTVYVTCIVFNVFAVLCMQTLHTVLILALFALCMGCVYCIVCVCVRCMNVTLYVLAFLLCVSALYVEHAFYVMCSVIFRLCVLRAVIGPTQAPLRLGSAVISVNGTQW